MKILSQTLVPLDMAALSLLQESERVRTGEDDEPNHITLGGTLFYQEI